MTPLFPIETIRSKFSLVVHSSREKKDSAMSTWGVLGVVVTTLIYSSAATAGELSFLNCAIDKALLKTEEILEVDHEFSVLLHDGKIVNQRALCKKRSFQLVEFDEKALEFSCMDENRQLNLRISLDDGSFNVLSKSLENKEVYINYTGKCHSEREG
ncbi:hypothetical protein [Ovoidimarina sediminis]|uniref:hypothetical protein n=1 Tax=Ovoidimarina sediminis TaxID=3079856 RepID=UPI0029137195|nr:hypothetical protein [Rhodophyticola sp. MJ-SS7]MDU8944297.1 hypothetical protein [Rhodophyticola sp. MJ-SS7]